MKLKLNTDYKVNGNSTGSPLDTLAIAVDGRDSNEVAEYVYDNDHGTINYVLENYDYETDMLKQATKAELKAWLKDPQAQAVALSVFTDKLRRDSQPAYDSDTELAKEIQKAVDQLHDDNYKEWLHGDYRDWPGVLTMAERRYGDTGNGDIEFTTDKGEVYADITPETIAIWYDDGKLEKKTATAAREHLENMINNDARASYNKRMSEIAKRKAEHERLSAYRAEQAKTAEIERQAKLKKLIKHVK